MKKSIGIITVLLIVSFVFSASYSIEADFQPEQLTVKGTATIVLNGEKPEFLLLPNLNAEDNPYLHNFFESGRTKMEITGVFNSNFDELSYTIETYPATLLASKELREECFLVTEKSNVVIIGFKTFYEEKFEPENVLQNSLFLWRFAWYPLHVSDTDTFILKPHKWKLSLNYPEKWLPVVNAKEIETNTWKTETPLSACPLIFIGKDKYKTTSLVGENYTVKVIHKKGLTGVGSSIATYAMQVLNLLEKDFGGLPYSEIFIIQNPYPGLYGMTTSGVVTLGDGFFTTVDLWINGLLDPLSMYVVAHEITHLWFGVGTSTDFLKGNFLSEGITDYIAHNTFNELYGSDDYFNWDAPDIVTGMLKDLGIPKTLSEADQYLLLDMKRSEVESAVADNVGEIPVNYQSIVYYQKAKRAFFMLQDYLGKDKLYDILAKYQKESFYIPMSEKTFVKFMASYVDEAIINDLFLNKDNFDAGVYRTSEGIKVDLDGRNVPVKVEVVSHESSKTFVATETTTLVGLMDYEQIHIDPDYHSYDVERHNNHWPPLINNPFELKKEYNKLDAYDLQLSTSVSFNADGIALDNGLFFSKYPYYTFGLLQTSDYSQDVFSEYFGALIQYSPDNYSSYELKFDSKEGIEGSLSLSFPEKIKIGESAPYFMPRTSINARGLYSLYDDMYLLETSFLFDNAIKNGIYTGFAGLFGHIEEYDPALLEIQFGYIPDIKSPISSHISVSYSADLFNQEIINPFYDLTTLVATDNSTDPLFSKVDGSVDLLKIDAGFSVSQEVQNRVNILNLFSFGGIGFTLEGGYRYFNTLSDSFNVFELSTTLMTKLFIIGDTPINFGLTISVLGEPYKDLQTIALKASLSLGTSMYYGTKFSGLMKKLVGYE
ncbi:MAG: M1 family metallopeptidase [Kosmotoga sp.]|nr:MAG: M1 family metallopeptidase [Kosmotoga sp.]